MKAVAIDLDSTALTNDGKFSDYLKRTIEALHNNGTLVFIATGRSMKSLKTKIPEDLPVDGFVAASGVVVMADGKMLRNSTFKKETIEDVISIARDQRVYYEINTTNDGPFTFKEDKEYSLEDLLHPPEEDVLAYETIGANRSIKDSNQWVDTVDLEDVIKLYFFSNSKDKINKFYKTLDKNSEKNTKYALYQTAAHNSEIMVPGVDKGTGLKELSKYFNIELSDIHVFGDSMNDIPMFKVAGKSIAMKNAINELKLLSDDITEHTNDDDGLAQYIEAHYL